MAKKQIEILLKTKEETINKSINAIIIDNTIKYTEDNIIVKLNYNDLNIVMIRENNEYQLTLNFKEKQHSKGEYVLKENNFKFDLDIFTEKLYIDNNNIEITYILNDEKRIYKLHIKE